MLNRNKKPQKHLACILSIVLTFAFTLSGCGSATSSQVGDTDWIANADVSDSSNDEERDDSISVWNGESATSYGGGYGTVDSPYLIDSAQQFAYFRDQVNSGNTYPGQYFKLTTNIQLSSNVQAEELDSGVKVDPNGAIHWEPIGAEERPFDGNFDGDGYIISGLYLFIDPTEYSAYEGANFSTGRSDMPASGYGYYGLFGCIDNGSVRNLRLDRTTICFTDSVINESIKFIAVDIGSIAGMVMSSNGLSAEISNCESTNCTIVIDSNLEASLYVGGIVGYSTTRGSTTGNYIYRCKVDGEFFCYGDAVVGGIIGSSGGTSMTECVFGGNLNIWYQYAANIGGIAGSISDSTVALCISGARYGNETVNSRWGGVVGNTHETDMGECRVTDSYYLADRVRNGIGYSDKDMTISNVSVITQDALMDPDWLYGTALYSPNAWEIGDDGVPTLIWY